MSVPDDYTPTAWEDQPSTVTPITAARLNKIEQAVKNAFLKAAEKVVYIPVVAVASADGALTADRHTPVDASSAARSMTLPTPTRIGQRIRAEKTDSTLNLVTITGTLRGATSTVTLVFQNEVVTFTAESLTSWRVESGNKPKSLFDAFYESRVSRGSAVAGQVPTLNADGTMSFATPASGGSGFSSTVMEATKTSGSPLTSSAFTTVAMPNKITDPGNNFNTSTGFYTVPSTGLYLCLGQVRTNDSTTGANISFGLGIHTSNTDGTWFAWTGLPVWQRRVYPYRRLAQFTAGDQLRLFYYYDSTTAMDLTLASMQIMRLV